MWFQMVPWNFQHMRSNPSVRMRSSPCTADDSDCQNEKARDLPTTVEPEEAQGASANDHTSNGHRGHQREARGGETADRRVTDILPTDDAFCCVGRLRTLTCSVRVRSETAS
jgi:hypothetical protein